MAKPCHSLWTTNLILELIYQIYYDLKWTTHILNIRNKAYLALCQEELIYHCPHLVKGQAYKITSETNVGNYSYGSTVWGLYSAYQKSWLGQVQHRAACFITRTYVKEEECVTNALKQLNWPTLENRSQVQLDWHWCTNVFPTRPLLISPAMCNISPPLNQGISSTEIYSTWAILWHVEIQLRAKNYHWLE